MSENKSTRRRGDPTEQEPARLPPLFKFQTRTRLFWTVRCLLGILALLCFALGQAETPHASVAPVAALGISALLLFNEFRGEA